MRWQYLLLHYYSPRNGKRTRLDGALDQTGKRKAGNGLRKEKDKRDAKTVQGRNGKTGNGNRPMYRRVYVCVCIYIYIYIYTHTYIYTYTYLYNYTHTHVYLYLYTYRMDRATILRPGRLSSISLLSCVLLSLSLLLLSLLF